MSISADGPKCRLWADISAHRRWLAAVTRLRGVARTPNPDEAVAIAAAIERFRAETAPASGEERDALGPWQRAALIEGVSAKGTVLQDPQGGLEWLS